MKLPPIRVYRSDLFCQRSGSGEDAMRWTLEETGPAKSCAPCGMALIRDDDVYPARLQLLGGLPDHKVGVLRTGQRVHDGAHPHVTHELGVQGVLLLHYRIADCPVCRRDAQPKHS